MGFLNKSGWMFLVVVLIFSFGIIDYAKNDSFFGLYSFEEQRVTFYENPEDSLNASVYFCPEDFCEDKLVEQINSAEESIDVAIYSFSSNEIAEALINAKERGVEVRVVFDYLQASAEYSVDEFIESEGIKIKIKKDSGAMHNKFCIIDGEKVLTGSYNYSANANERNDENLVFLIDEVLAREYSSEFNELWEQAKTREELAN
jgi:phosphatidylserine/phosphatidylglycerophosphate/cardiolipin synthase-like enzyme